MPLSQQVCVVVLADLDSGCLHRQRGAIRRQHQRMAGDERRVHAAVGGFADSARPARDVPTTLLLSSRTGYRVPASLTVDRSDEVIEIPTSRGERRPHNRVGRLSFTLKGQLLSLTAFVEVGQPDMNHLFVPFGDLTNGTETYPGGRYLESGSHADGHLRSGLQPRVSSVLLLQPQVRLPVSST